MRHFVRLITPKLEVTHVDVELKPVVAKATRLRFFCRQNTFCSGAPLQRIGTDKDSESLELGCQATNLVCTRGQSYENRYSSMRPNRAHSLGSLKSKVHFRFQNFIFDCWSCP
ncbi:hypothetical protein FOXYSP1_19400 [Fusarium oxysporum f. sp. phaseoli]